MKPNTCLLVDVWEADILLDEAALVANNVAGCIIRLNDMNGGHHMDKNFIAQWAQAGAAGLIRAPYFVYNPWVDGAANHRWLMANMPASYAGRVFVDIEVRYTGYSPQTYAAQVDNFMALLSRSHPATIYTAEWFLPNLKYWPGDFSYWWAQYPYVLHPDKTITTTWEMVRKVASTLQGPANADACPGEIKLWQVSGDRLILPGSAGKPIDVNIFDGTRDELAAWINGEDVVTPPAPVDTLKIESVIVSGVKIPEMVTVNIVHNGVGSAVMVDQRPVVAPPPPPVAPKLMRIKDDLEAGLKINGGTRPGDPVLGDDVIRSGWPATVRYHSEITVIENGITKKRAGRSNIKLTPDWLAFARAINPDLAYKYQFDDEGNLRLHVGWCNTQTNVVEYVTFGGNHVEVTRIEGNKAYLRCYHINEPPPVAPAVLPLPKSLHTQIQMFTVQYATYLDMEVAAPNDKGPRYPRTFIIAAPGEEVWMDVNDLVRVG